MITGVERGARVPIACRVKLVIFGCSVSSPRRSAWAAHWRGLLRALGRVGHRVVFFEREACHDDDDLELQLFSYDDWEEVREAAELHLGDADAAVVTSDCPDETEAVALVLASHAQRVFYDLSERPTARNLRAFDLVLGTRGGRALDELRERSGAHRVAPLLAAVDPEVHHPGDAALRFVADLSYRGVIIDREAALERLLIAPAERLPRGRFLVAGAREPREPEWPANLRRIEEVAPREHAAFYSSAHLTLSLERGPSPSLFEAAACGAPILSDGWDGLEGFFTPNEEILIARTSDDALAALALSWSDLRRLAARARARTLDEHSAQRRADQLLRLLGAPSFRRATRS